MGAIRALVLSVAVLLGAVGGAWLALAAAYMSLPSERTLGDVAFIAALDLIVSGLALLARWAYGSGGLAAFVVAALLGAFLVLLTALRGSENGPSMRFGG